MERPIARNTHLRPLESIKPFVKQPLAIVVAAAALTNPQQTLAEELTLEEVVVTAQFREQSVQDTPLSITAVSAEMLEARNQTSIDEIANQAPSVSLQPGAALFGPSIQAFIRGIGQFDFNPAYEPGVGMYIDDVYYPTLTGGQFDLLDLDRVEVLRGPQGTLTGRNSIGGAIKLFTRKPSSEPEGYAEFGYGSRDMLNIRAGASFALTDRLSMRLAGVHKEQDGWVDVVDYGCANPDNPEGIPAYAAGNCVTDKLGEEGYTAGRVQLRYEAESWSLDVSADRTEVDRSSAASILYQTTNENFRCGDDCTYADYRKLAGSDLQFDLTPATSTDQDPRETFKGWGVSSNVTVDLTENVNMQWISAWREYDSSFDTDDDWTPQSNGAGGNNRLEHEFFSQELRFNVEVTEDLFMTVGAYYSDQKTIYSAVQDIRYIAPGLALQFWQDDPVDADSQAIFTSFIYDINDKMTLTAGIRYTEETKEYTYVRVKYDKVTPAPVVGSLNGLTSKYDGDEIDYRISLDYDVSDSAMVYATIATGFKGGGVSARPFDAAQALNGTFDPETLTSFEVGTKMDMLDGLLRLNLSAYYYEYEDVQQPIGDCSSLGSLAPCGAWQNAGDGEAKGFEAELAWRPTANLNIDASMSYYDFEWTRLDPRLAGAVNENDPKIWVPDIQWSMGAQYRFELAGGSSITPRVDVSYTDKRFMSRATGTPFYTDDYTLVNASVAWRNAEEDLSITLAVKNATDEDYQLYLFDTVQSFSGNSILNIGEEREWSVTVKKNF